MDQAPGALTVTPNASLPRTIGALNIALGLVLLLCGAGCLRGTSVVVGRSATLDPDMVRLTAQEMRRNFIDELRQREAAAADKGEKARLRREWERLAARPDSIAGRVDFARVDRGTRRAFAWLWADVIGGPILNLMMFVAGVGLVRLKRWGLRLGVWIAGLKLLWIAALAFFAAVFVVPALNRAADEFKDTDFTEIAAAKMREDQKRPKSAGAQPIVLQSVDLVQITTSAGYIAVVLYACLGAIYPLIALIVLTRPAAVAAFARSDAAPSEGLG